MINTDDYRKLRSGTSVFTPGIKVHCRLCAVKFSEPQYLATLCQQCFDFWCEKDTNYNNDSEQTVIVVSDSESE